MMFSTGYCCSLLFVQGRLLFLSFSSQSTLCNNLLANHSFSVEHSAMLPLTKCGVYKLSSTASSTVDLDAVELGTDS